MRTARATIVALAVITAALVAPSSASAIANPASAATSHGGPPAATFPLPLVAKGPSDGVGVPPPTAAVPSLPVRPSASGAATEITPACTLAGVPAPIAIGPGNFTVTADFTGSVLDECNGSALNGDGYTLTAPSNASFAIELYDVQFVEVSGFLIVGASTGIIALGAQDSSIVANTINATGYGIEVEYSTSVSVDDNTLDGDYGSLYEVDDGLTVDYNLMERTQYSVYAEDVNGASFIGDQCDGSTSGISLYDSTSATVWGDNLSNTTDGLYAENVNHLAVDWNNASFSAYPIQVFYGGATIGADNAGTGATVGLTVYFTDNASFTTESFVGASEYGAEVEDATNVSISGSDFDLAGFEGVFVADSTRVTLTGDTADRFVDGGVVVTQSTDVTVTGTSATNGTGSLAPAFSTYFDEGLLLDAVNGSSSAYGLEDQGSLNLTVRAAEFLGTVGGDAGISLQNDAGITVTGTYIIGASGDALDAFASAGLVVTDNVLADAAQEAIYVANSDGVTIVGNDAAHAGFTGLDLEQLDGFTVNSNNASSGSGTYAEGIYLQSDASGTVSGNTVTNQPTALSLLDATDVTVSGNALSTSGVGLDAAGDVSCTIAGNTFVADAASFNIGSSEHLAVYHNNFIDDAGWVLPPSTLVANWSAGYPGGGNYWSNFTTPDAEHGAGQNLSGADGIVDDPFVLNATNVDPYPLAQPWTARTVDFVETGLPSGTPWAVTVNGSRVAGSGTTLVFDQPNAVATVYAFGFGPVPGYRATPSAGTVAPGAGNATVTVTFAPFEFAVSFQASGLAGTTNWSVAVGGTTGAATGDVPVTFDLANGSYTFAVAPVAGYAIAPSGGPLIVDGADESVTIAFNLVVFTVTFEATGLPAGATWSIDLDGNPRSSTTASIGFEEPNGTFAYSVAAPGGYVAHPSSGQVSVNGTTTLYVAFTGGTASPLATPVGGALLAATIVLAVVAIVAFALWLRARRAAPVTSPAAPTAATPPAGPPEGAPRWRR